MPGLLDTLVPVVKTIVDQFGATAIFDTTTGDTYDPATGARAAGTPATVSVTVTPPDDYRREIGDALQIERGDVQIGLPASGLTFTPDTTQKVTVGGKTWQIAGVLPIYTGEQVGLYMLNLRGGK